MGDLVVISLDVKRGGIFGELYLKSEMLFDTLYLVYCAGQRYWGGFKGLRLVRRLKKV